MKKAFGFIIAALGSHRFAPSLVERFIPSEKDQQVVLTQFGAPSGDPITEAGLHFKLPFIVKVNVIEKRCSGLGWRERANADPRQDLHSG